MTTPDPNVAWLEGVRDEALRLKKSLAKMHNDIKMHIMRLDQVLGEKEFADPKAQRTTKLEKPLPPTGRPR